MHFRRVNLFVARLLTALGTSVFLSPPASAQQLVYTHAPDGSPGWPVADIYSMRADGSGVRALTHDGHSHDPSWSPDGQRILFIHDSTLRTKPAYREQKGFESHHPVELYLMNANGSNARLIRRLEPVIYDAAWSPDGGTIAITCLPGASKQRAGLYLMAADGKGQLRFLFRSAFTPSWSPHGRKLAFSVEQPRGRWAVHVANSDGSGDIRLTDPRRMGGSPAWSPGGEFIAFDEIVDQQSRQQVFVMKSDGSEVRQLTRDPNWSCGHPSWSPDGRQIAVACRSAGVACGTVSSVGVMLPACTRRIFMVSWSNSKTPPRQVGRHDAACPAFRPAQ